MNRRRYARRGSLERARAAYGGPRFKKKKRPVTCTRLPFQLLEPAQSAVLTRSCLGRVPAFPCTNAFIRMSSGRCSGSALRLYQDDPYIQAFRRPFKPEVLAAWPYLVGNDLLTRGEKKRLLLPRSEGLSLSRSRETQNLHIFLHSFVHMCSMSYCRERPS
jgi:hypothetical protein